MYERKTKDVWVLMSNYGYGWDEEWEDEDCATARMNLRLYRENCPHCEFYLKKKRVPKEEW